GVRIVRYCSPGVPVSSARSASYSPYHTSTSCYFFFFQAEDGIRDRNVTGVQTCALPIYDAIEAGVADIDDPALKDRIDGLMAIRSEEHTSELQSRFDLVCRLLLEKKKQ